MRAVLLTLLSVWSALGQATAKTAALASNAHACELFQFFRQMTDGNFCFSPFSSHQMAILLASASVGETHSEMATFAHLSNDIANEIKSAGALRAALAETARQGDMAMEITNSLWSVRPASFEPTFVESARASFGTVVQQLPTGDAISCAAAVNLWVREKTRGRIAQVIGPSAFAQPAGSIVVVNTVYLKAQWWKPFDPKLTKPRAFQTPRQGSVKLPTMLMSHGAFDYAEAETWKCLEMPMTGGQVQMLILLPKNESAREKIENSLTPEHWDTVRSALKNYDVNVMLPRFAYSTQLSLKPLWQALGAKQLFQNGSADLAKGFTGGRVFVSDISHEAVIEVNELGAVATAVTLAPTDPFGEAPSAPTKRRIASFVANHPFIWMLRHQATGLILFMGRYTGT